MGWFALRSFSIGGRVFGLSWVPLRSFINDFLMGMSKFWFHYEFFFLNLIGHLRFSLY